MSSNVWEYWASKAAIQDIEINDIGFLVEKGLAVLRNDGERCRCYEVFLAPGMPNFLMEKDRCKLRFWYGSQTEKAKMWCKWPEFEALSKFLLNGNGHKAAGCWH